MKFAEATGHIKSTESTVVEKETVLKIGIESERLSSTDGDYLCGGGGVGEEGQNNH